MEGGRLRQLFARSDSEREREKKRAEGLERLVVRHVLEAYPACQVESSRTREKVGKGSLCDSMMLGTLLLLLIFIIILRRDGGRERGKRQQRVHRSLMLYGLRG